MNAAYPDYAGAYCEDCKRPKEDCTCVISNIASQDAINNIRELINNRLLDITDFFETGDFQETCNEDDLAIFEELHHHLKMFTDAYNITGCIGKVVE